MLKEFKQFALKGNMLDLAIGLVLGAAFGAIVTSLVKDILMPPLGRVVGGVDFTDLFIVLGGGPFSSLKAARDAGAATINYGVFLNTVVNFLIVAGALFFLVKAVNVARLAPEPPAPSERECRFCVKPVSVRATRCPHCTSQL
jgi:large conductance mechanosensitive channel